MATKRKYRVPKYRNGGRVPVADMPIADDDVVQAMQPPEPTVDPVPVAPAPVPDDNPLGRAVEAQARAEELARRPPDPIDSFPISEFKKQVLREHPELLGGWQSALASQLYRTALQMGLQDDTPEVTDFILGGIQAQSDAHHQHATENVKSGGGALLPQRTAPTVPSPAPPAMVPPRPRSMPMSAPVSRDIPSASGQRVSNTSRVTLSAEERDMAHRSFTDPSMSDEQKERLYAQGKLKLQRMRASGEYPGPERN